VTVRMCNRLIWIRAGTVVGATENSASSDSIRGSEGTGHLNDCYLLKVDSILLNGSITAIEFHQAYNTS
jgi:hypothetical protein